ncbi:thioredoxin domain-containing protein [Rhodococcus sp. D2-41]|uniref:DsbA family protein n=1 Tax=Speluncibacter jeojiensis TaxID=2710754 RepID=A0A9X4LVP1_9ACTN|nr:thioredoxin domain-containing protein [Rhodococcus sp. D2-41]MDG3008683.1 thioredoxin domain-containing protein [Rhodococcus sp. D2-41]MDG3013110.1 DsbA family protein [Corynebacteriales bacterium D3-21]
MSANQPGKKPPKKVKAAKYNPQPQSSTTTYVLGGLAIVVIAAVVIGLVVWQGNKNKTQNAGYGTVRNAAVQVMDHGVIRVGKVDAKTTIDAYEDFMCPACAQFERIYGQAVAEAVDTGQIAVRYHMLNFLNSHSASKDYSDRAAGAAICVADTGDGPAYSKFRTMLFEPGTQPEEGGSTDLSNAQLADIAKNAGASPQAVECVSSGAKVDMARQSAEFGINELQQKIGTVGTPTILHNDQKVDVSDPNWLSSLTK